MDSAIVILLGTLGMLILAVAVVFMMMYHQRRVIRHQMEMREKDLLSQKASMLASVQGQESERKRIAEDLHDEVGALLSCVKLNVSHLQKMPANSEAYVELAGDTKEILDNIIQQVRAISRNLHPSTLAKFGFVAAIREFAQLIDRSGIIKTTVHFQEEVPLTPEKDTDLILFRVVQEWCNNVIKYAQATTLDIHIIREGDRLRKLQIIDNGSGFSRADFDRLSQSGGSLGLKNIIGRLDLINGTIRFEPVLPKGTMTEIVIGE